MMCGGNSAPKQPTDEDREYVASVRDIIEQKAGKQYAQFELIHFTTQVVAGTNYWLKIKVGDGATDYIHAKVYKKLPHYGGGSEVTILHESQSADAEFDIRAQPN